MHSGLSGHTCYHVHAADCKVVGEDGVCQATQKLIDRGDAKVSWRWCAQARSSKLAVVPAGDAAVRLQPPPPAPALLQCLHGP